MGKITINLPDNIEKELRDYVREKYGDVKGALTLVIIEAIAEKISKEKRKLTLTLEIDDPEKIGFYSAYKEQEEMDRNGSKK